MASSILPTPSNFLAVALVINRSRDGPAFVFHYPAQVSPVTSTSQVQDKDDELFEGDDIILERLAQPTSFKVAGTSLSPALHIKQRDRDEHYLTDTGSQVVPWEEVAGFPTRDLAGILTPSRHYHKKLFQLSLDPLYCVSYPIHVPESGSWKTRKKANKLSSKRTDGFTGQGDTEPAIRNSEDVPGETLQPSNKTADNDQAAEEGMADKAEKDDKRSSMTMFNLVFVLNPKKHEVKGLVDTLYLNIIKKINKAYKYAQQHSDFVWKESKRIIALKEKGREEQRRMSAMWQDILASSSLAASMQDIFEAVSQNKIAALQLDTAAGPLTPSFQIPVPFYISELPQDGGKGQPGLWLTTANTFVGDDDIEDSAVLDKLFALLLMDDEKKIINELQADPDPTTAAMIEFVRLCKPTTSFYQVGQNNILTLNQVRKFAQHFIFWRRAIAIPPLHGRDVYTVSPNCNLSRLPRATVEWQKNFPHAMPLPNFLAELSNAPRPYKHYSPAKAHRPAYLTMLAWLMRGGWVTQLCTFAYVVVWPEILYEVDYAIESDEIRAAEKPSTPTSAPVSSLESSDEYSGADGLHVPTAGEQIAEKARLERIADKAHREAAEKATAHARKTPPSATEHPAVNNSPHLAEIAPYIILDAKKATGKDSLYLSAIGRRFQDEKVASAWPRFWKYFNGQSSLEQLALQEDMKRKEAWALLTAMSEYLLCVRHW